MTVENSQEEKQSYYYVWDQRTKVEVDFTKSTRYDPFQTIMTSLDGKYWCMATGDQIRSIEQQLFG